MKNMKKLLALLLALCLAAALLAGCGNQPAPAPEGDVTPETEEPAPAPENPADRVVTVTDMSGDEVTITGPVEEIIDLWPAGTSSFFVMGAGDLIVGVGNNSPGAMNGWTEFFYPGAREIFSFGAVDPSVEDIVAKAPDLVIIHPTTASAGLAQQIRDMGIPAVNLNFSNYDEMIQVYTTLGEILGGEYQEKLNTWCADVQAKIETRQALVADLADEDKPVVYYISGQAEDLLTTMPADTIMQEWVELSGGIYASTMMDVTGNGMQGSNVTAEEVFRVNPDVIIVGGVNQHALIEQLQTTDGWKDLNAVVNGRVYNNPYGCFNWDRFGLESLLQLDYALLCIQPELAAEEGISEESMLQEIIDFYSYYNGKTLTTDEAANMLNGLLPDGSAA